MLSDNVADQFSTGDLFCVRIHYITHERIIKPTFGLAIYRNDGVHVNGPNSVAEGFHIDYLEGEGYVDYRVDALPLNPGRYELTAAIYNRNSTIAIDHHHRMYEFEIKAPRGQHEAGVVHLPATWRHVEAPLLVAGPEPFADGQP